MKAMGMMRQKLADEHLALFEHYKSAQELWEAIEAKFQAKGYSRRFELLLDMLLLRWDDGDRSGQEPEQVLAYIGRGQSLVLSMIAAGFPKEFEEAVAMALLNGLPQEYKPMLDVLKTLASSEDSKLSIDYITPYLKDREKEIVRFREEVEMRGRGLTPGNWGAGMYSGSNSAAGGSGGRPGQKIQCYICSGEHMMRDCPKFQREQPEAYKEYMKRRNKKQQTTSYSEHQSLGA